MSASPPKSLLGSRPYSNRPSPLRRFPAESLEVPSPPLPTGENPDPGSTRRNPDLAP
ncbi:hypothetical protein M427DRAFT_54191 [Gonapodya prolifera JEL478]|uniref:Uncharacterized protein n=1 Tax=Gonapodya prolifera (strain JEL478) TaxID=1344416 RepID=A0A139AMH7_GONPJ|nr:hypothetical protein M427DRAFT_54191 [Gonapodya prolifera JEL478]|eukprot:KXS17972.1 hypothetical protein M427DRAFT_54191 [Gonapodya prolifera JEL478]